MLAKIPAEDIYFQFKDLYKYFFFGDVSKILLMILSGTLASVSPGIPSRMFKKFFHGFPEIFPRIYTEILSRILPGILLRMHLCLPLKMPFGNPPGVFPTEMLVICIQLCFIVGKIFLPRTPLGHPGFLGIPSKVLEWGLLGCF